MAGTPPFRELQPWFDLQSATLRRVHASWLAGVPPELIASARSRPLGRRWLAQRLHKIRPLLFGLSERGDGSGVAADVALAAWLLPLLEDSMGCALEVGSLALAGTLRTLVARSAVMRLRQALGPTLYERMLAAAADSAPLSLYDARLTAAEAGGDVVECVTLQGAWELAAYADRFHPACGESVRLSFERAWWQDARRPRLSPEIIEAALRARQGPDARVSGEAA
jgi:hypothetical protein